jgi:hypothetical protein
MNSVADIDLTNGLGGLLVSLCVILTFHLIVKIGVFLWGLAEKKNSLSEKTIEKLVTVMSENTKAIQHLDNQIKKLESVFAEVPKLKLDLRRLYFAIKLLASEQWSEIREEIMRDFNLDDF